MIFMLVYSICMSPPANDQNLKFKNRCSLMCVYIVYNESLSRVGNNTCYLTKYLGPAVEHTLGLRGH
jgi:hypothetical protein